MTTGSSSHTHTVVIGGRTYTTSSRSHTHSETPDPDAAAIADLTARVAALENPTPAPTGRIMLGAFDDANAIADPVKWRAALDDLKAHGITSIATTNGFVRYNEPLLSVSDSLGFTVLTSQLMGDLIDFWYPASVPATIEKAREIVGPLVDKLKGHPSVIGHNILDDATPAYNEKMRLALQVIKERAPHQPASPTINEVDPGGIIAYTKPTALLLYNYPCRVNNANCSWVSSWLPAVRSGIALAPAGAPVWFVLSTHSTEHWGTASTRVRYPSVEEVRLGTWLVLGEGARGVWFFTYTTMQGWTGFRDNPPLYAEITALARRIRAVEGVLGTLTKVPDEITSTGYVSTMRDPAGRTYAVVVNTSCASRSITTSKALRDIETGTTYAAGSPIPLRGGDGTVCEVTP